MKRLQELDHFIFGRHKFWIYPFGIMLIVFTEKYDYNKIIDLVYNIVFITIFFLVFFIVPRKFLINYVIRFNRFILDYFPFIFKIRMIILDVSYCLRIILSYMMYLDKLLIKILFLNQRVNRGYNIKAFLLFIRKLVYYNLWIFFTLPFYLIIELYEGFKEFIELKISLKDYLMWRTHFLFLSVIFVLLLDVKRVTIIILLWILDTIIMVYYYWIKNWVIIKSGYKRDWKGKCLILRLSFYNVWMDYNSIANMALLNKRFDYILLFKGIQKEQLVELDFQFVKNFRANYSKFWNQTYIGYQKAKDVIEDYYDSETDSHFVLKMLYKIGKKYQSNINFDKKLLELGPEEFLKKSFVIYYIILYQPDQAFIYNIVLDSIKRLHGRSDSINRFYELALKYRFNMWIDFLRYEDVRQFLIDLYMEKNKDVHL